MDECGLPSVASGSSSFVHQIFGGFLRSQVKCGNCSHCSPTSERFNNLSLVVSNANSLEQALSQYTALEHVDDGYNCDKCNQNLRIEKNLTVSEAPNVLMVHLKLFDSKGVKINKKVSFGSDIDMKPFFSGVCEEKDLKYTLYAVLVHHGQDINRGHYTCYIRSSTGIWHYFNDENVTPVTEETVFNQKAYMSVISPSIKPPFFSKKRKVVADGILVKTFINVNK